MKQINFAITTLQKDQPTKTGTQLGEHGLATRASLPVAPPIKADEKIEVISSLTRFTKLALEGSTNLNLDRARGLLAQVDGTCDWNATAVHLSEFIDGYSQREVSSDIIAIRSNDFMRELNEYPTWAVLDGLRWYKSKGNKFRHAQPKPGDIADYCHKATDVLRASKMMIDRINEKIA